MEHHTTTDDDRHDRGLVFDLATLRARGAAPSRLPRRGALQLLAGAGAGLLLAACGGDGKSSTSTSVGSSSTAGSTATAGSGGTASTAGAGGTASAAGAIPTETAGPFPGDGTNGPDVLTESGIVRRDIRTSFAGADGVAAGVPLTVELTVTSAGTGAPIPGAAVYVWHCDREGRYSLYSIPDQNYLRGVQAAAADGRVTFTSIFPGAYSGRWPHIHFEVFPSLAAATSAGRRLVTSQLALPQDACEVAYAADGYEDSVGNLARTSLASDMVFGDGADRQVAALAGDGSAMTASLAFAV